MEQANFPAFPLNEMERRLKAYMEKHPKLQNTVFTPDELSQFIARLHQENKGAMQSMTGTRNGQEIRTFRIKIRL